MKDFWARKHGLNVPLVTALVTSVFEQQQIVASDSALVAKAATSGTTHPEIRHGVTVPARFC